MGSTRLTVAEEYIAFEVLFLARVEPVKGAASCASVLRTADP
jgi:hypothetical protein